MAKTIVLEFTDAQWELIQEYYVTYDGPLPVDFTEESFIQAVQDYIGIKVTAFLQDKLHREHQNDFNV